MNNTIVERVMQLRKDALQIAQDSLDHDIRVYRVLSDVAVRLTDIVQQNDTSELQMSGSQSASTVSKTPIIADKGSSRTIQIHGEHKGISYHALLDPSRISSSRRGRCVYFEGLWMTASAAAGRVTSTSVNGWKQFWRYNRDNGVEAPIHEIRELQLSSNH